MPLGSSRTVKWRDIARRPEPRRAVGRFWRFAAHERRQRRQVHILSQSATQRGPCVEARRGGVEQVAEHRRERAAILLAVDTEEAMVTITRAEASDEILLAFAQLGDKARRVAPLGECRPATSQSLEQDWSLVPEAGLKLGASNLLVDHIDCSSRHRTHWRAGSKSGRLVRTKQQRQVLVITEAAVRFVIAYTGLRFIAAVVASAEVARTRVRVEVVRDVHTGRCRHARGAQT